MSVMFRYLAHGGENHSDGLEAAAHYVAPWYLAIPVFLLVIFMVGYLVWLVSGKNTGAVAGIVALVCLIAGFTMFTISPAVSIIAILSGILLSGFIALTGISNDS